MKKLLVAIVAIALFVSCKKDDNPDPQRDAFMALQGKYLVCQSIKTTIGGISKTEIVGKGKGYDLTFGLYGNLDIYTSPTTSKKYQFESPDKIYYWTTTYDSNQYYTIQSISGSNLVLVDTDKASGRVITEYFTAE